MYISFNIIFIIIATIIYVLIIKIKGYHENKIRLFFQTVMFIYIILTIGATQFPISFNQNLGVNIWDSISIIPFSNGLNIYSIYNIVFAVPFGIILPFLVHENKKVVTYCLLFGVIIEALQFLIAITIGGGYTYRYIEVEDIIYNSMGGLMGFAIFIMFSKIFNYFVKNKSKNTIYEYIYSTTSMR